MNLPGINSFCSSCSRWLQLPTVALEDLPRRHSVTLQPQNTGVVLFSAKVRPDDQFVREGERRAATDAQVARILTASGALGASDACHERALGRAIPLAGRGEGWSAPQLPLAHLTKSPRSLLVPVGGFMSRARRSSRPQPGHDRNALSRPRRHRRRNYPAAGACESTSAAHAVAGLYPTNSGKPASPRPCTGLPPAVCAALPRDSHRSPRPHGGC